jgi:hypothetical protein
MRKTIIAAALTAAAITHQAAACDDTIRILQARHDRDGNAAYTISLAAGWDPTDSGLQRLAACLNRLPADQMKSVSIVVNPDFLPQTITTWPFGADPGAEADPED